MPQPRELGAVARAITEAVIAALESNSDEFFNVVLSIHAQDAQAAVMALKEASARNNLALRALTLMQANRLHDAETVILDAKLKAKSK